MSLSAKLMFGVRQVYIGVSTDQQRYLIDIKFDPDHLLFSVLNHILQCTRVNLLIQMSLSGRGFLMRKSIFLNEVTKQGRRKRYHAREDYTNIC